MPHQGHPSTLRRCAKECNLDLPLLEVSSIEVASFPGIVRNGRLPIIETCQADMKVGINFYQAHEAYLQQGTVLWSKQPVETI